MFTRNLLKRSAEQIMVIAGVIAHSVAVITELRAVPSNDAWARNCFGTIYS